MEAANAGTLDAGAGLGGNPVTVPGAGASPDAGSPNVPATIDFSSVTADSIPADLVASHPNFKALQSTYDKQMADMRAQLASVQSQQNTQVNQAQLDYAAQLQSVLGESLDPATQQQIQLVTLQEQINRHEADKKATAEQSARDKYVSNLSSAYGIDATELAHVTDPLSAHEAVAKHQQTQLAAAMAQIEALTAKFGNQQNAAAHTPDLGGGAPPAAAVQVQADWAAAWAAGDIQRADDISRHAAQNNITLDRSSIWSPS